MKATVNISKSLAEEILTETGEKQLSKAVLKIIIESISLKRELN